MTSVLKKAGFRTGTFISPHLVEIRERFLINGELVENGIFEEAFRKVKKAAEAMMKEGFCHPTFFEFLFYMAMVIFAKEKVDVMVIETGLGGRLDATNVLEKPAVCVITSISKDHMQYLGTTIPEIAGEKAGIIKAGVPVVFDDSEDVYKRQGQAEGLKTLRAMWKQDPAGQLERAGRLVGKWKDEYRVTQG